MGKKMISEQIVTRNGQKGFVGPDGKWYPIAGQGPAIPNFGERLPGESTIDFHNRLRGDLPSAEPAKPKPEPKPAVTQTSSGSESFPLKRERTAAEISGLEKWASIYGPGKRKELKQFTPSQERLFKDLKMEAYDVVLDYLLSEGHADTVEEAHYVMMQMDAEYIQSIVEN